MLVGQVQFFLTLKKPHGFALQLVRVIGGALQPFAVFGPRFVLVADQCKICRQINNLCPVSGISCSALSGSCMRGSGRVAAMINYLNVFTKVSAFPVPKALHIG